MIVSMHNLPPTKMFIMKDVLEEFKERCSEGSTKYYLVGTFRNGEDAIFLFSEFYESPMLGDNK